MTTRHHTRALGRRLRVRAAAAAVLGAAVAGFLTLPSGSGNAHISCVRQPYPAAAGAAADRITGHLGVDADARLGIQGIC